MISRLEHLNEMYYPLIMEDFLMINNEYLESYKIQVVRRIVSGGIAKSTLYYLNFFCVEIAFNKNL